MDNTGEWVPEIMYEQSDDGLSSKIPFIQVPKEEDMPQLLFVFESRDTGEVEPGLEGEEVPVVELDLHQYANMATLKKNLSFAEYDNVRYALGLESFETASIKPPPLRATLNHPPSGVETRAYQNHILCNDLWHPDARSTLFAAIQ